MRSLIALTLYLCLFCSPAMAKPTLSEIMSSFCDKKFIEGNVCKKTEKYPSDQKECEVHILQKKDKGLLRLYEGDFIRQGQNVYLVEYYSSCEGRYNNWGGALVFEKTPSGYKFIKFARGFANSKCLKIYRKNEKDKLYCTGYHMRHGIRETSIFEALLIYDVEGDVVFSSDIFLRASKDAGELEFEKNTDGWSSTFVNCSNSREFFEVEIISKGPDQYSLLISSLYAGKASIQNACRVKHIPNKNLMIDQPWDNHAFIHSSKMKRKNFILDTVKRKIVPIDQYKPSRDEKVVAVNRIKKSKPKSPLNLNEKRIALVVGNANYKNVPKLKNSIRDSKTIADKFKALGFHEVIVETDLRKHQLEKALIDFSEKSQIADWSVVYFAGHGIELDGENYLIPTDAHLKLDKHIKFETVSLDHIIESASGAKKLSLVILDACRNNPFLSNIEKTTQTRSLTRGLAKIEPSAGVLVAFAAKHGMVALDGQFDNSPFVKAILKHIEEPNLDINLMFRKVRDTVLDLTDNQQEPYVYGSLPGHKLSFRPRK